MAGTKSEIPFSMNFATRPPTRETQRQTIAKEGGRYDNNVQGWKFRGGKSIRETRLGETGTNIKDYAADDKAGKDE